VGTIAAGVAKAGADVIHIAGHSGGTAAASLNSIKHTGIPWELGLTDAHRQLLRTRLRARVALRVDGDLRTGHDIVVAAAMGAQEFAFGSVAMMAEGCIMARVCHTNDCPTGVATQREDLRRRFAATPEHVEPLPVPRRGRRALLSGLGFRSSRNSSGAATCSRARRPPSGQDGRDRHELAERSGRPPRSARRWRAVHSRAIRRPTTPSPSEPFIEQAGLGRGVATDRACVQRSTLTGERTSSDCDKHRPLLGAGLAGPHRASTATGVQGRSPSSSPHRRPEPRLPAAGHALPPLSATPTTTSAGVAGGDRAHRRRTPPSTVVSLIAGNTCLYGATGGDLFAHPQARRATLRGAQLGASAVVEGAGHHCCEYMTAGTVVVLGESAPNACAGMTGGLVFLLGGTARPRIGSTRRR
jgi:glutamate synthase (ferredoxin)